MLLQSKSDPPSCAEVVPLKISTDLEAKSKPVDGTRRVYRVTGARGLRFDVRAGGARTWVLVYRTRTGKVRTHVLGRYPEMTLKKARDAARNARARVDLGEDPQEARLVARRAEKARRLITGDTIGELVTAALESQKPRLRPGSFRERKRLLENEVRPAFGPRRAATLTRAEIRAWSAKIARRAPTAGNRAFEALRRLFSWAIEQDILEATPFVRLAKPSPDRQSDRVLSTDEVRLLWVACCNLKGAYCDALRLLLLTGVRREMVCGMHDRELAIEGADPRWTIPATRTKGKRSWVVPLSTAAVGIVHARHLMLTEKEQKLGYLFPPVRERTEGPPHMTWSSRAMDLVREEMVRLNGKPIERWWAHALRHTLATHMREDLNIPLAVVALILGHAEPGAAVTRIYNRAELLPERRVALQAWGDWVWSLAPQL